MSFALFALSPFQMRVSMKMPRVLLCLTAKGIKLGALVYAGCPADRQYVYIEHNGRIEAIDARVWPFHRCNPGRAQEACNETYSIGDPAHV